MIHPSWVCGERKVIMIEVDLIDHVHACPWDTAMEKKTTKPYLVEQLLPLHVFMSITDIEHPSEVAWFIILFCLLACLPCFDLSLELLFVKLFLYFFIEQTLKTLSGLTF